jgi:hypothetical protein
MQDIIAWLVSLLVLEPLEGRLAEKLQAARVPEAVVAQVQDCTRTAAPVIANRIMTDPFWGVQTAVRVWIGTTSPDVVLGDAVPACQPVIEAAQPFLRGRAA